MSDAGPHLDLDALADALAEAGGTDDDGRTGESSGDSSGDGGRRAHLRSCASCADRLAELEASQAAVVASLRALPEPAMPAGLAERLQDALRAEPFPESDDVAAATASAAGRTVPTVTPLPTPLARRRSRPWVPAAAASLALVAAVGLGYGVQRGADSAGESTAATAAGAAADPEADAAGSLSASPSPKPQRGVARNASGLDYADERAVTAALPELLAGTATGGRAFREQEVVPTTAAAGDAKILTPRPEPSSDATDVGEPVPAQAEPTPTDLVVEPPDPLALLRDPFGLASCVSALLPDEQPEEGPEVRPIALDYASYLGTPALAVVLPDPNSSRLVVYVVGADCTADDPSVLGFLRIARPSG